MKLSVLGNIVADSAIAEELLARLDADGSGYVEPSEFLAGLVERSRLLTKDQLQRTFELFDEDGSGTVRLNKWGDY
jgi:Ca2+-binding EF-hand superfamily protein